MSSLPLCELYVRLADCCGACMTPTRAVLRTYLTDLCHLATYYFSGPTFRLQGFKCLYSGPTLLALHC